MVTLQNLYRIYHVAPHTDGTMYHKLMGTFAMVENGVYILSDYHGWLEEHLGHGPLTPQMQRKLSAMKRSSHLAVVTEQEIRDGYRPDLVPEDRGDPGDAQVEPEVNTDDKKSARPPSVWHLHRIGQDKPATLEYKEGKLYHNGFELTNPERDAILHMLHAGSASLRYVKAHMDPQKLGKMERAMERLMKAVPFQAPSPAIAESKPGDEDYHFGDSLRTPDERAEADKYAAFDDVFESKIKPLHQSGAMDEETFNAIRSRAYEDGMAEGIGNKASYFAFLKNLEKTRQRGTHIMIDGNDFKSINDNLSHAHGDEAIRMYAKSFRRAVDTGIGRENAKMHRFGGDEFHIWVPESEGESPEQHNVKVQTLLRDMRRHMEMSTPSEKFPELNTSHKLSFSAGIAKSPRMADAALNTFAKASKKAAGKPKGQAGFHFHSLVRGMEGPVNHEGPPSSIPKLALPQQPQVPVAPAPAPAPQPKI